MEITTTVAKIRAVEAIFFCLEGTEIEMQTINLLIQLLIFIVHLVGGSLYVNYKMGSPHACCMHAYSSVTCDHDIL